VRRLTSLAAVLALAATAQADTSRIAVPSLALPLDVAMRLEADTEHSCSQSFASTRETSTVSLRVDRRGNAVLEVDRLRRHTFGPSRGRYQQGARDFSHTAERETHRYQGRARRSGAELELSFGEDRRGRVEIAGPGQTPAPPPTTDGQTTLRLLCRIDSVEVYPPPASAGAYAAAGETGEPAPLVRCAFPDGVPDALGLLGEAGGELSLGRGAGVVQHYHRMFGGGDSLVRLP